jgi:hypothetical protein
MPKIRVTLKDAALTCWDIGQNTTFTLPWAAYDMYFNTIPPDKRKRAADFLQNAEEVIFDTDKELVYVKERPEVDPLTGMYEIPEQPTSPLAATLGQVTELAQDVIRSGRLPMVGDREDYYHVFGQGRFRRS